MPSQEPSRWEPGAAGLEGQQQPPLAGNRAEGGGVLGQGCGGLAGELERRRALAAGAEVQITLATTLIRGGTDLVTLAGLLGHARPGTVRLYTRPSATDRERALNLLPYGRWPGRTELLHVSGRYPYYGHSSRMHVLPGTLATANALAINAASCSAHA